MTRISYQILQDMLARVNAKGNDLRMQRYQRGVTIVEYRKFEEPIIARYKTLRTAYAALEQRWKTEQ